MENLPATQEQGQVVRELTVQEIGARRNKILEVMKTLMKKGVHYGVIPGCQKPSLFKAGAEMLVSTFRLTPSVTVDDLCTPDEKRYRVTRKFYGPTGNYMGDGIGEASTNEEKFKWRKALSEEEFEYFSPELRRIKFKKGKNYWKDGLTVKEKQLRTESSDLANTVLKIGDKRAYVGGVLLVTGASEYFTQDIEDLPKEYIETTAEEMPQTHQAPQRQSQTDNPTPAQLEEIRKKKAEDYAKANPAGKMAPADTKASPAKPQTPPNSFKTAIGFITEIKEPNKGGFVNVAIEGYLKDNGKPMYFSTRDNIIIETLNDRHDRGEKVGLEYTPNENPAFASSILGIVSVAETAQEEVGA